LRLQAARCARPEVNQESLITAGLKPRPSKSSVGNAGWRIGANMGSSEVTNSPESPLQQLCDRAKLGDESKMLRTDELSTKQFLGL
jgi:hypothetical protein